MFRVLSGLIALALIIPTGVKLLHSFEHQEHDLCSSEIGENLHKCEFDCSFLKYNLQQYYFKTYDFNVIDYSRDNFEIQTLIYNITYNPEILVISLRAPPVLV